MACYESDLRVNAHLYWSESVINDVPDQDYSVEEWRDFLGYVLDQPPCVCTVAEAKELLICAKCKK